MGRMRGLEPVARMQGVEEGFVCFHVAAQVYAGLFALDDEGADDFGDLTLAGGESSDAEVTAQFRMLLQQGDLMATK